MASYSADLWSIFPRMGTRRSGRVSMCAETYGVSSFTRAYSFSAEAPSANLPARDMLPDPILRKYTRVGGKARRALFGFAPTRRWRNPPGGHFRRRCGSLRSTEGCAGRAARIRGRSRGAYGRCMRGNCTPYHFELPAVYGMCARRALLPTRE